MRACFARTSAGRLSSRWSPPTVWSVWPHWGAPNGFIPAVWRRRPATAGVCGDGWSLVHSPPQNARHGHPRARSIVGLGSIGGLTSPRCLLHHFLGPYCPLARCEPGVRKPSIGTVDPTVASPFGNHVRKMVENVGCARGCPTGTGRSKRISEVRCCGGAVCGLLHQQLARASARGSKTTVLPMVWKRECPNVMGNSSYESGLIWSVY